jgi:drug/metabolite transporter (DMT)-like permease
MIGGAVPMAIVSAPAVFRAPWRTMPMSGYGAIGYSAIFSLVVAYFFWYRGVRVLGPTRTAMYSNLQPVVAVIVACAALGETPTVWQILGASGILGGLFMTRA